MTGVAEGPAEDGFGFDPLPSTPALGLILGLTAGLVLAWSVPILAVVLVWPWLFAVPGWVLVRRVAPDLPRPGVVGVGIVASTYLSAHLVELVSRLDGFGRIAVLVAVLVLVLTTALLTRIRHPWLAPWSFPAVADIPSEVRRGLREDAPAWIVAGVVGLVVLVILGSNGWRETPDGMVSGGWNWSDLLVHVAIGNSIVHGNFPPEVPYFAGEPLTYHWFADFHGAIAATAANVPIIPVFFLSSALMAAALALVAWSLALVLTGRRLVATIAAILVCFGGGMGWLRLGADLLAGNTDIVGLITENPYDNSWSDGWPFFRIASVLGTGFLPHRATTFGLPGLVAVVLLVVACLGRRPGGRAARGFPRGVARSVPLPRVPGRLPDRRALRGHLGRMARPDGPPRCRAVPGPGRGGVAVRVAGRVTPGGGGRIPVRSGLERGTSGRRAGGRRLLLRHEPRPAGPARDRRAAAPARRAPGTASWVPGRLARGPLPRPERRARERRRLRHEQVLPDDVDLGGDPRGVARGPLAAPGDRGGPGGLCDLPGPDRAPSRVASGGGHEPAPGRGRALDRDVHARRRVFLTDAFINSPVDLAGRLRMTTFGPYVSNLGYDPAPREEDVHAAYCDGPEVAVERMAKYGATYVLSSGGVLDCDDGEPTDFASSPLFETVYDADGVSVWRLR